MDQFIILFMNNQAVSITRQYCTGSTKPDEGTRMAEALTFAPSNAARHGQTTTENGSAAPVYISQQLAKALAAGAFVDCDQNPVAAGTFSVGLDDGWDLVTGTCP